MLIDTHAHLDFPKFKNDQAEVIQRAKEAGIEYIFNIGADERSSKASVALARKYPQIYAAVGVHPHDAKDVTGDTLRLLRDLAQEKKVRAIGEIGLDYHYDFSPRDIQQRVFRAQLRLAHELKLPVIIHSREADEDTMRILKEEEVDKLGGIMHCFAGDLKMAEECLKLNLKLAFGGVITFPNAKTAREVVKAIPLEHLLLETDSPYLTPVPYRGKRNEPAYVRYVAEKVAKIKGVELEEVAQVTTRTAKEIFKIEV
ncbi:hydrolase TatD [Anoxybacter fermentans]|uniref:Hydrolase TatD n=1 Tax=Anoxybacter fermentans TaxID=1323375 RepID=A0A3S9T1P7_9FIRM|nr:TatD family hydrolase [Anoxybacter fermentans]AZR74425.1 hydrolase TatD [Anoxybacter fermentans]